MLASWVRHGGDLKIITPNREVCQMDAWTGPPSIPSLPFPSLWDGWRVAQHPD